MASARHVIVAGAGIAGLTAALAMARVGLRVTLLEQAAELQEVGAGIQLSPNATRVLIGLGLRERLQGCVMAPQAIRVMAGGVGREIVRIPLGSDAERRYGSPYWTIHRGDLQAVLADAARNTQDIEIKLDTHADDFATHVNGITVQARSGQRTVDQRGVALIGADGLWSTVRARLLPAEGPPRFRHRTAWRTLLPAEAVAPEFRAPLVHLWLGQDAHLVHYPVKGGRMINIVAIVHDMWKATGWAAAGDRAEILRHFARWSWEEKARELIATPAAWLKWALYDRKQPFRGGTGPVTLIGDAAHPMLPFIAQGSGMAIEDAAVLADMLSQFLDDPADALRAYEGARWHRTARAQFSARRQSRIYGLSGPEALVRNLAMRAAGGQKLRARYDWIYDWQPPALVQNRAA